MLLKIEGLNIAARQLTVFIGVIAMIIITMQGIAMMIIRKKIILPIQIIEKQMLDISNGNLSSEFNLEENTSEIGMLSFAISTLKRKLNQYISGISDILALISQGELNHYATGVYEGDFIPIKNSLNQILDSLNYTLSNISISTKQVFVVSDQVSSSSGILSHGAITQASTIEELSSTVEVVTKEIEKTSQNTIQARELSNQAVKEVDFGNTQMESMQVAMRNIADSSAAISKIIKSIEDIAFQTNILALNAAVEAARAGEAGKGFAVVADEVRSLATKSAEAAKSTSELIENSSNAVQIGIRTANETANSLKRIVNTSTSISDVITQINTHTNQQSKFMKNISESLGEVSGVVQTNAATAEESAATSEELSAQVVQLSKLISNFKCRI